MNLFSSEGEFMVSEHHLAWLDLEMTGLDPKCNQLLQIAMVITDSNLSVQAEGQEITIHQSAEHMCNMEPFVQNMHINSGLLHKVAKSTFSVAYAQQEMLSFVQRYCVPKTTLLCGNSIWVDRGFLKQHMPHLEAFFHYRMIDVSTVKELVTRWYPQELKRKKEKKHTALSDIYESIDELRYYRERYFV